MKKLTQLLSVLLCSAGFAFADAPGVGIQPSNSTNCPSTAASFTVVATGSAPLSYQWYHNDTNAVLDATNASVSIVGVTGANAGGYSVFITNAEGSITSSVVQLVVLTTTSATGLSAAAACPGGSATFTTTALGDGPFAYVWRKDGGAALGSTSNQLDIVGATAGDAGVYSVEVTGACGSVASSAPLTVNEVVAAVGPSGTTTICAGGSATFATAATGTGLSYVWRKDGGAALASTSNQLDIAAATVGDSGVYSVEVSGACGSVTNSASLAVNAATVATGPSATAICPGAGATLTVVATGTAPLTYVWRKDGGAALASDSNQLDIVSATVGDAGVYSVEVTGACGSVTNSAALTVSTVASATGPSPATVCAGQTASFTVTAEGTGPFTYVWRKAGGAALASTTSTLSLPAATVGDAGTYEVEVTGVCGSVTNSASLAVNELTTASGLSGVVSCLGSPVNFTTTAGGTGPFTYVWRKVGGGTLAATGGTLDIAEATLADAGTYTVEVSGTCNTVTNSASLTIVQIPVNHAITGVATQSSTYQGQNPANLAIDGAANSFTHTSANPAIGAAPPALVVDNERAWQLDLGSAKSISRIRISLRTDCCGERNTNLLFEIRDASYALVYSKTNAGTAATTAQVIIDLPALVDGRYVRIQNKAAANHPLSVAEVEVFSPYGGILTTTQNPVAALTTNELSTVTLGPVDALVMPSCAGPVAKLDYQWQTNGVNISGATGSNYTFVVAAANNGLSYRCIMTVRGALATLSGASVTSSVTALTVLSIPPVITVQPADVIAKTAAFADRFSVTAAGTATLGYQWYSNGVAIAGATGTTLSLSNLVAAGTSSILVVASNGSGYATSRVATLTVDAPAGISFDFNSPLQFTNLPYYLVWNNWVNNSFVAPPVALFERSIGGVGAYPGSGSLDMIPNNGTDNTSIMLPVSFDFSQPGKTLYASTMFKIKNPTANTRAIQFGFATATNLGINDVAGQGFATVILQSTAQPVPTYELRHQRKNSSGTGGGNLHESIFAPTAGLVLSNWYKLSITFTNLRTSANSNYAVAAVLQDMGPLGTAPGATILSFVTATNNADFAITNKVFLALRTFETAGIENHDNIFAHTAAGPIFFAAQPASLTLAQGRRGQFKALVNGSGPYTYQWQRYDGVSTYTNIPGAGSWNYIVPSALTADNGAQYQVVVTGPANSITSDPATLTVTGDTLAVVSAGSVDGTTVGVMFNQPVDLVTAVNPANYLINGVAPVGARIYRTSLGAMGPEGIYVILTPASVVSGAFTVTASGVTDLSGGALGGASSASSTVDGLTGYDINPGINGPPGVNYSFGTGHYIVEGNGTDIYSGGDAFRFVYKAITGDFDLVTRIPRMDSVRYSAKAGIHARRFLDPFSPHVGAFFDPGPIAEQGNVLRSFSEGTAKQTWGAAGTGWGTNTRLNPPDVWLRLRRTGNNFLRYYSTNGVNWILDGQIQPFQTIPPQDTMLVGLANCSARNLQASSAQFESFGNFAGYPGSQIIIDLQPSQLIAVYPGQGITLPGPAARLIGSTAPNPATELAYLWQRSDGADGWTNMPTGGTTSANLGIGVVWGSDNGAVYRCVLKAPGAADVVSASVTMTVVDFDLPLVTDANSKNAPTFGTYPLSDVVINFNELMGVSALNTANYTVTNAAGVRLTILSVAYLGEDKKTVVIKVDGILGLGTNSVGVSGTQDLYGNTVAPTVRTFRSYNAPTAPVVVEVYQDIGAGTAIGSLLVTNLYTNSQPTWIVFSNQFGFNTVAAFGSSQDNYGVKAYTYFVPPTNGAYKFWIRGDDAVQLFMNTNGTALNPPDAVTAISTPGGPFEAAQFTIDTDPNTKFFTTTTVGAGFIVAPGVGATTVTGFRLRAANDAADRDPATVTLEGSTAGAAGPWTALVTATPSGLTPDPTRYGWGTVVSFANANAYTHYKVTFPTIRGPGTSGTQISEIELLNASGTRVTSPNLNLLAAMTGANTAYVLGTVVQTARTNITLVGGQRYYMEARQKEGTGGDGFSVMWTDPSVVVAPANTLLIPLANLDYPVSADPNVKAITELYTGYQNNSYLNSNWLQVLILGTNFPTAIPSVTTETPNFNYVAGLPAVVGYQKYFATQPDLYHTRYDNYLGRMMSYFVPPTNGIYKFYMRSDDGSQFWMNTNAVDSTSPAGKALMGHLLNNTAAYTLVASNLTLVGGQKYYMETLHREGGGGDGVALAVRSQNDASVPAITPKVEVIPNSMLELPVSLARVGPVTFGIIPANPVVADGDQLLLCANNLQGTMPYGAFTWLKNGVRIFENTTVANIITNITPPLTMADNGAVYSLVVSNLYSRVTNSVTITVLADTNTPTVARCVGYRYGDGFTITYSEPVDAATATFLGNYSVSGGLRLLTAKLDPTRRTVTFTTSAQAVGTTYTVTINGVCDASSSATLIAPATTTTFSTWSVGGNAVMVELFTNIVGGAIADLIGAPKFANNTPDVIYYTNNFGVGTLNGNTGRENYGARVTSYFIPTNTGLYRFYIRGDDASQLWMNINSTDSENPAGRTMLLHVPASGLNINSRDAVSPPVALNQGQRYYMEGLLKEGGGGDYLQVAMRYCDASGTAIIPGLVLDLNAAETLGLGNFGGAPGNPDLIQIVSTPPADFTTQELSQVSFQLVANIPASIAPYGALIWQKSDGASSGVYTNIPGATGTNLTFNCRMADDGFQYRLLASYPGLSNAYVTTLHVVLDATAPYIVSVGSLTGWDLFVTYDEPVDSGTSTDPLSYTVDYASLDAIGLGSLQADQKTVIFSLNTPITTPSYEIEAYFIFNQAAAPLAGDSVASGKIAYYSTNNVGVGGLVGIGGYNNLKPTYAIARTNDGIDISANGWDIWNAADGFFYVYRQVSGNFDVKTRVQRLVGADQWSKAGFMVRPDLTNNARMITACVSPDASPIIAQAPINAYTAQWRLRDGNAPFNYSTASSNTAPAYPNAWIRLQRVGSVFNAYASTNGLDWFNYWGLDTATNIGGVFPDTFYLGLAASSHDQTRGLNNNAWVEFRDIDNPLVPTFGSQPGPDLVVVGIHQTVTFSGAVVPGATWFQWRKDGAWLSGETNVDLTVLNTAVSQSGTYTLLAGSSGGGSVSSNLVLLVTNTPALAGVDSLAINQGGITNIESSFLLANDSDVELDALTILGVSGVAPVTYTAPFTNGAPAGSTAYGSTSFPLTGGVADGGYMLLHAGAGSVNGSLLLPELTPNKRVSAFSASFMMRIGDWSAATADGFSFNFASDLPLSSAVGAENGVGTGFTLAYDAYLFAPFALPGTPSGAAGGGTANTAGFKLILGGTNLIGVQVPQWTNSVRWVPVSVAVAESGAVTVLVDGTNVFGSYSLPNWTPRTGRLGLYGRTGGSYESHAIDELSFTVRTLDTARGYAVSGATLYGNAAISGELNVPQSGALHVTDAANNQAGSYVINELTPGQAVQSFNASFKLRVGQGSPDGADGISFNFGSDIPNAASPTVPAAGAGEEGAGVNGLSICLKNYPALGPNAPALKIKTNGVQAALVLIPKWNSTNWVPINVVLSAGGALDLVVDGTNVVTALATGYTPIAGRFGFFARTGGANENHWVDDINLSVATAGSSGSYSENFNSGGPGTVVLSNGVVVYNPADNACGDDSFYYLVSDGQVDGGVWSSVTVNITPTNGLLPAITTPPGSRSIAVIGACVYALPDLRGEVIVSGNCVTLTQSPVPGTELGLGGTVVTITATDSQGNSTSSSSTVITGIDTTAPTVTCPDPIVAGATGPGGAVVTFINPSALDNCDGNPTVVASPASGSTFPVGVNTVTVTAYDASLNTNTCTFMVTVTDTNAPSITCPVDIIAEATSGAGRVVTFDPTAGDAESGILSVTCTPASGSTFAVGLTTVTCVARDYASNSNSCAFNITIVDTTAPVIDCPTNQVVQCTGTNGVVATWTALATDLVDGSVITTSSPASGSTLTAGTNVVTVTAVDAHNNTNTCTFQIVVEDPVSPVLAIVQSGTNVTISWPASCTTYLLKSTGDLSPVTSWTTITNVHELNGPNFEVVLPASAAARFYKLQAP